MDRLGAMRVFVTVVDLGSQSAAADFLELSRPAVSRNLAELEEWTGTRLMHRTTRKLSLTAAGLEVLPRCRQLLELASDLQTAVSAPDDEPVGELRVSVSSSFGQTHLMDAITDYLAIYPKVRIDLQMFDRTVNLIDERIDLAVRTSNDIDPSLIARRLSICRSVVCASPAYLARFGTPADVEDLAGHNCLTHSYFGKHAWYFERDGVPVSVPVLGNISANDAHSLQRAALRGTGIALLPTYLAAPLIERGELIRLLPWARPRELDLHAIYASRKHMSSALRTLLAFLVERFPAEPQWDSFLRQ